MEEQQELLEQARRLTSQLEQVYARFRQRSEDLAEFRREEKKGLAGFLRGIFPTPQPTEPEHQRFLADVEEIADQLAQALAGLGAGGESAELARRAVTCILAPKPLEDKNPEEWFMTAAEGFCLPLLPHLSRGDMETFRADMIKRVPKRYRFPRQEEVLRRLDELLA